MKLSSLFLTVVLCAVAPITFARDKAVEAPIRQMMDGFNKGDIAMVKAAHVASPTIVDNVAPFVWSGPNAFDQWIVDLGKSESSLGIADGKVTFAPVVDEVVKGERAYVVTRSVYVFKQKGRAMREDGYTAFVLVKTSVGWKVESWSWASPVAK
ncbi:MAG: hypothetical protein JSS25_03165 [Proteobacteria bacterium]|nr:hypothetical protein [Pseudomonadota bacterium]